MAAFENSKMVYFVSSMKVISILDLVLLEIIGDQINPQK